MGGDEVKKSFACTNEGVFIAKGETNPCGCLTTLITVPLPWLFKFTWLFIQQVCLLDFHVTWHCLTVWPTIEVWTTWLTTRLDMTILVHSCCCWCACLTTVLLVMDFLMVCHSFTSAWKHAWSLQWSLGSLDVAFSCCSLLVFWKAW